MICSSRAAQFDAGVMKIIGLGFNLGRLSSNSFDHRLDSGSKASSARNDCVGWPTLQPKQATASNTTPAPAIVRWSRQSPGQSQSSRSQSNGSPPSRQCRYGSQRLSGPQRSGRAELAFPVNTASYVTSKGFRSLKNTLWSKTWVVDVEPPLDNPDRVMDYVGRYTHRVAISNLRILDFSGGKVTFSHKNREKGTVEALTIDAAEFIRRFLPHTLPKGLMRIRYYGFLANRCKRASLKKAFTIPIYIWYPIFQTDAMRFSSKLGQ